MAFLTCGRATPAEMFSKIQAAPSRRNGLLITIELKITMPKRYVERLGEGVKSQGPQIFTCYQIMQLLFVPKFKKKFPQLSAARKIRMRHGDKKVALHPSSEMILERKVSYILFVGSWTIVQ